MRLVLWLAVGVIGVGPVAAQTGRPASWKVRLDKQEHDGDQCGARAAKELSYVTMSPGWHVTTNGSSGILYDPAWQAQGNYAVETTIFLFPSSEMEGYGLFLGGHDLAGTGQSYLYFLLRRDGKYLVKHRAGTEVHDIKPWTEHAAILKPGTEPAKNVITIEATPAKVAFLVNGTEVTSLERREIAYHADGAVGLRLNQGMNVHVTGVKVTPRP